jgi:hypothetical protein
LKGLLKGGMEENAFAFLLKPPTKFAKKKKKF